MRSEEACGWPGPKKGWVKNESRETLDPHGTGEVREEMAQVDIGSGGEGLA